MSGFTITILLLIGITARSRLLEKKDVFILIQSWRLTFRLEGGRRDQTVGRDRGTDFLLSIISAPEGIDEPVRNHLDIKISRFSG